ncbi:DUF1697 domain-containing protein [Devosia chinhatensis]|uniref:DUF1697 domain-containing protein n=1 Tax=Devosia chinhatensis TaxID=429727 RepID=UPI0006981D54|nr:DUF1697 domain-containing protein [Devosia chinhatensis]
MPVWCAFLRGINLGKRQMQMAELRACLEAAGCTEVKTVLASGNVRFTADGAEPALRDRLETAIGARFGFKVGVVLRPAETIASMLADNPFGRLDPNADLTRHVVLFDQKLPEHLVLADRPGDTEIVGIGARDIYIAAYRQPNGRYTEHVEEVLRPLYSSLASGTLDTMRNWNTIEKILK